jgi:AcrR family transcriptional regulator
VIHDDADRPGDLFVQQGYGTTSVRQIADAAQVAPDTVYATFGSKARLLTALVDIRLVPGGQASVFDRPQTQVIRQERDPRRRLRLFARDYAATPCSASDPSVQGGQKPSGPCTITWPRCCPRSAFRPGRPRPVRPCGWASALITRARVRGRAVARRGQYGQSAPKTG